MPAPDPDSQLESEPGTCLRPAADQAIAACGGDARNAVKALIVANEFLEAQIAELEAAVSHQREARSKNRGKQGASKGSLFRGCYGQRFGTQSSAKLSRKGTPCSDQ
jgi:hypothetical protein